MKVQPSGYSMVQKRPRPSDYDGPEVHPRNHPPVVYYVRRHRLVKIGTTTNLPRRLKYLGVKADDVLALEPGSHATEHMRHRQFAHLRQEGHGLGVEHFRLGPSLAQHIRSLRDAAA